MLNSSFCCYSPLCFLSHQTRENNFPSEIELETEDKPLNSQTKVSELKSRQTPWQIKPKRNQIPTQFLKRERERVRDQRGLWCAWRERKCTGYLWARACGASLCALLPLFFSYKLNYKQQPPQTCFLLSFLIYSSNNLSLSLSPWLSSVQFSSESLFAKKKEIGHCTCIGGSRNLW